MGRPPIGERAMTPAERKARERRLFRESIAGELREALRFIDHGFGLNQKATLIESGSGIASLIEARDAIRRALDLAEHQVMPPGGWQRMDESYEDYQTRLYAGQP